MSQLLIIHILLFGTIVWALGRTEYARSRAWRYFGVQLLVCVYSYGLAIFGHSVASILGNIALLPVSLLAWVPLVGFGLTVVFFPLLGHLLASSHLASKRFWFCALILMQYAGLFFVILTNDDSLSVAWQYNPLGFPLFWLAYVIGQLAMWGYLIHETRNSRQQVVAA